MRAGGSLMWWVGAAVAALIAVVGCKGGDESAEVAEQALEKSGDIEKAEEDLLARRDALVKARQRIREQRDELSEKRRAAIEAGADVSEIDEAASKLLEQERDLVEEEQDLNSRYREIIRERRELVSTLASAGGGGGEAAAVAAREKSIAQREKDVASLAGKLAEREAKLAEREAALAKREAEMCGGVQPQTIIQTVDAKGSKYTKKDVEPLLRRARRDMSKKGVRRSDLPAPAQDLEKEATDAMADGDYGRARFAASQLVRTVRSIRVDKAFVQAKFGRLNARMKGKKLSSGTQSQVDKLFREATANYGDGKFRSANRKLNKIYSVIN